MRTIYKPIKFPKDESAHNHMVEWWYFNGHLKDNKDNEYAFMDCLFRVNVKKLEIPLAKKAPFKNFYFAHSIISDIKNRRSYSNIKHMVIASKDSFTKPLLFINYTDPLVINGYEDFVIEETKEFNYKVKTEELDLNLKAVKKPMFESGKGFTDAGGNKSFYYSLTNLKIDGQIKINKKKIEVRGKGWMDHQWTNSAGYYDDKWNWFSMQLDDSTEIMCNEYIAKGNKRSYLIDIMHPDGKHESLKKIKMIPKSFWISKKTKEKYPVKWRIEIPERKII